MNAIDTNVLVRLLVADDMRQAQQAAELIDSGQAFFVPITVVLELEWILRGFYKLKPLEVQKSLEGLLSIRTLHFESESRVQRAVQGLADGFDFADLLHHLAADGCDVFYSFDRKLSSRMARMGRLPPVLKPGQAP
ncbi:MAG: hypothetical protein RLY30_1375 [Pseudomonadota bacterium]